MPFDSRQQATLERAAELAPRPGATEKDHDRGTDEVMAAINATGEAFFTGTTWRGRRCMRVSVSSWRTTAEDVDRAVAAAERALGVGAEQRA
jgi:glutamate/tyrosine decarboxylase-like PLP-dependent enzyme